MSRRTNKEFLSDILEAACRIQMYIAGMTGELTARGAACTGTSVRQDGRIVTASDPQAIDDFVHAILTALEEPWCSPPRSERY